MPNSAAPQVKLLHRMVERYSPTGQEGEMARLLAEEMRSLGLRSTIDEAGNVIGESSGGDPVFLLCGHMDTIPGRLPVRVDENRLYGRGAVDAKPALAAMICAAGNLVTEDFPGKLVVVGAVDEEGRSQGVKSLVKKGIVADYAIFGEPSGVDNITIAYKGSLQLKLTCRTNTGHSSAPWLFRNAVEEAFNLWEELKKVHFVEEDLGSRFYSVTSALTGIHGGSDTSTVPSQCDLHANFRLPPAIPADRFLQEALRTVEAFRSSRPDVGVEAQVEDSCEGYEADPNSVLVRGLSWAVREIRGNSATLLRKTGTGDMNILGAALRIPAVTYGAGDSKLDHTDEEYVNLNEYLDSIKVLQKSLVNVLDLHNRSKKT